MDVYCGIDWAEDHHDISLADRDGQLLARRRISDDAAGLAALTDLLAEHGDTPENLIPVAIETPRGLLVACLRVTGRKVYPINPMSVARYRDRHSVAGRKSDHGDSFVLANVLRTDLHAHRPLPADSELAQAIAVLARAQQDAVWDRTTAHNKLRSHLREYFPGFLAAFASASGGIMRPEARTILAAAPAPAGTAQLTLTQLRGLLKKAGRSRGIDTEATRLRDAFRVPQMRQLPLVEQAMGRQTLALLGQLNAACTAAADLERAATESFNLHPDAGIITSFPGLGVLTGARVLAEIGDDRSRFQDAKGLKAYAGAAPITRASGKTTSVTYRRVKNNRLNAAGYSWAFSALTASPGARGHYDRRRDDGDRHAAAQRNLFGRLLGCLHHCLITGRDYDETIAFPAATKQSRRAA
ncbi:MAG TPA: IS110 family transposase [Streptosporangiaceae bacterium]|nr:IS110 family transposase [Streptosporangiaceae bacterium]